MSDPLKLELNSCDLPCECWELNLGPLEQQGGLLTSEPRLGPTQISYITWILNYFR